MRHLYLISFFFSLITFTAHSQCVPITLDCPDDITITLAPGECGAFVSYTINTTGTCALVSLTQTDTSGYTSGDEFPIGEHVQSYVSLDAEGNVDQCSFTVYILEYPNPIDDDACNANVNVSPDGDCEALITPDMILEGGPYGCYDNYTVILATTAGDPVPNPLTADYIGETLMATVLDPNGNSCWGYVHYEDYLVTDIICAAYEVPCGSPILPSVDTAQGVPFPIPAGYTITPASGEGPFVVEDYDNCGDLHLSFVDQVDEIDCTNGGPYTRVIYRTWSAVDNQGNSTSCMDTIGVLISDITSTNVFPNRNGTEAPSILCSDDWDLNGDGIPQPDEIGDILDMSCDVWGEYEDIIHPLTCGILIDRAWNILNMCTGEYISFIQQIKLEDDEAPNITCEATLTGSADVNCESIYHVPPPVITDGCSEVTYTVSSSFGVPVNIGSVEYPKYIIEGLPLGTYTLTYTAVDGCGNTATCVSTLVIEDYTSPRIKCESQYTVHLGTSSDEVTVDDLLVFYTDGCGIADKKLRRLVRGDCIGTNNDDLIWHDRETFCCEEAGQTIVIEVGVWDIYGNLSTCIVNVFVNDNVAPSMTCPPDITISCAYDFDYDDLSVFGSVVTDPDDISDIYIDDRIYIEECKNKQYTGPMFWGTDGLAASECDLEVSDTATVNTECGRSIYQNGMYLPAIIREFTVSNENGEVNSCTQRIYILDCAPQQTAIDWPADVVIDACLGGSTSPDDTGYPSVSSGSCDEISTMYVDSLLQATGDTCQLILRRWTATSSCGSGSDTIVGMHDQRIYFIKTSPLVFEDCQDTFRNILTSVPQNLIVNGDFEQGPIGFTSEYEMGFAMAGKYVVTLNPGMFNGDHDETDHTTGDGLMLMVDASFVAGLKAWCQPIDVLMGESYNVSAWVNNVVKTNLNYLDPTIDFVITTYDETIMSVGPVTEVPNEWIQVSTTWVAPETTTIEMCISTDDNSLIGNDFAIDDIAFVGMSADCALNPDNGCEALVSLTPPTALDCDTAIAVSWEIDADYDGTFDADLSGSGSTPTYLPFGHHRIRWIAQSVCGEEASCESVIIVEDCEPPTAICEDIGVQILQDTSGITITADQIAGMSMDNCSEVTAQFLVCEGDTTSTAIGLFSIAPDTFFQIDLNDGHNFNKNGFINPSNDRIYSLTYYDPEDVFYSVQPATPLGVNSASIVKFSKQGDLLETVTIQDYNGTVVSNVDGLAYNPADGKMYISANLDNDAGSRTESIMTIDIVSGELTFVTEMSNQFSTNDADRIVIENNILYMVDYVSGDDVYLSSMNLSALTPPVTQTDFIFSLGGPVLLRGLAIRDGEFYYQLNSKLIRHNIASDIATEVGQIHRSDEFDGNGLTGLAFAPYTASSECTSADAYGIVDDTLIVWNRNAGQYIAKYGIDNPLDRQLLGLTYAENADIFYSIVNGDAMLNESPSLIRLNKFGEIQSITELGLLNGAPIPQIESIGYDRITNKLYVGANLDFDPGLKAESLLEIDVSNGQPTFLTRINAPNGSSDLDRIAAQNGRLYYWDFVANDDTYFYTIDLTSITGNQTVPTSLFSTGAPIRGKGLDIRGDTLYIANNENGFTKISATSGEITTLDEIFSGSDFGGNEMRGIAIGVPSQSCDTCYFQDALTFDCSDLENLQDTFSYTIVVTDEAGLADTCMGEIIVADTMDICNPEACEFVYGVTTSGSLYSINTQDGAIEFVTNVSAPGNTNALGVNASLGLAYFGSDQTVYWVDIDDGSQGEVGDIGVPGSLSAAGASYRNGYYYMGPEIGSSIIDIFRVKISADGKSFDGALENLSNGNVPTGNFGDFIVVDGTPGAESMIMSINNNLSANNIYNYDVASNTFTLLHTIPASSSSQIAMDNTGTIWYFDNGSDMLGMLDLATGVVSNNNPTPITFADLGRSYCPGSAIMNLPGQVTHADYTRNRPNPFSEGTTIEFTLDKEQVVYLSIVSIDGRIIERTKRLAQEGKNEWYVSIDGPAGVYFYHIETDKDVYTNSMLKSDRIKGY